MLCQDLSGLREHRPSPSHLLWVAENLKQILGSNRGNTAACPLLLALLSWPAPSFDDGSEAIFVHYRLHLFGLAGAIAFAATPRCTHRARPTRRTEWLRREQGVVSDLQDILSFLRWSGRSRVQVGLTSLQQSWTSMSEPSSPSCTATCLLFASPFPTVCLNLHSFQLV